MEVQLAMALICESEQWPENRQCEHGAYVMSTFSTPGSSAPREALSARRELVGRVLLLYSLYNGLVAYSSHNHSHCRD